MQAHGWRAATVLVGVLAGCATSAPEGATEHAVAPVPVAAARGVSPAEGAQDLGVAPDLARPIVLDPGRPPGAAEDLPDGLSLGSRRGERLAVAFLAWPADFKTRSHFGFGSTGVNRDGEVAFVKDLGLQSTVLAFGITLRLGLGEYGWIGAEGFAFDQGSADRVLTRARVANGIDLLPGDTLHSDAWGLSTDLRYGYEVRARIHLGPGLPLELYASPTFGVGVLDFDVRVRRGLPNPTSILGGHATVWAITPGARVGFELLDTFQLGADVVLGMPGLSPAAPAFHVWERLRVFGGARLYGVELTVGWRLAVTHAKGDGQAGDLRLRGIDMTLGVRF